ncbi:flagellar FliJ protein [Pseudidiomarina planktonica]|uniref:Flagellar FliJ protein n=1 Tax=Pseudidiomarina planktonica TaxID=1323738 RepID=A0A1Y6FXK5_9GAMM|nr:flagellar export protein FliJ [Pseudidiomarina planktonica]RUO63232.1 flagellar export protein FliJ [Pseudidiomarina planktonica]SMQ80557.1 flagellar FliJ protein [Pseudidiomarina planktonica]
MAADNSLHMLLNLEQQREDKLVQEFALAQAQLRQQEQKLAGLEQYRMDYLRQLQNRGQEGIHSLQYGHYHGFVGKLDQGIQQLHSSLVGVRNAVEQRRQRWLAQRRKKDAIAHLLEQRAERAQKLADRREQRQLDEFASTRRLRAQTR